MPPIKRSSALKPLSSEHHQALLVAFQAKHASEGRSVAGASSDLPTFVAQVRRFANEQLQGHFSAEETVLGPVLSEADRERLLQEHRQLQSALADLDASTTAEEQRASLGLLGTLLEAHVRWEERDLFGRLEAAVGPEQLQELGERLARLTVPPACALPAR